MTRKTVGGRYRIEALEKSHDRKGFSCGIDVLDGYFKKFAFQEQKRKASSVFVAVEKDSDLVHGFYTLSAAAIPFEKLPEEFSKKLPKYKGVSAILLGRMAVHKPAQGRKLGTFLLMNALHRSNLQNEIGWLVFLVDAKNKNARDFYLAKGFQTLSKKSNRLFMMRSSIDDMFL